MQKELRKYLREDPPYVILDEEPPEFAFEPHVRTVPAETSLVLLGELQLARGDEGAAEAEALARQALEAEPENPRAMLLMAGALAQQGKNPGGELTVRALAIAPDAPEVVRGAACVGLLRLQKVDLADSDRRAVAVEARDLYARALTLAPDSAAAHAGLGYTQLALNQPADAAKSLQQAFLMERSDLNVVLALGELHAKYGRPEDARRLLREVAGSAHHEEMRARAQELLDGMDAAPAVD
jgi:Tfp pilus assembly protein PilF